MIKRIKSWMLDEVLLPLVDKNDTNALKGFAITMAIAFPVVFTLLLPWLFNLPMLIWPLVISGMLISLYLIRPKLLYYPYIVWMYIASFLGWLNTRIVLAIAYYLLIVPIGLFIKWRKGLQYVHTMPEKSAWIKRDDAPNKKNLKDPF